MGSREARPEPDPPEERRPFLLRLRPALLADLKAWADQDLRSLNAHIERILRDADRRHGRDRAH